MKTDNQPQHTQGEWRQVINLNKAGDFCIHVQGKTICEFPEDTEESRANAQRIVKAVNMHDELIAKLKNLASSARANNDYDCDRGLQEAVEDAEEFISENL